MNKSELVKQNTSPIPKTPLAFFWYVSKPFKWKMFGAVFFVMFAAGFGQLVTYFFKLIVDAIEAGNYEAALTYTFIYPMAVFGINLLYRGSGVLGLSWTVAIEKYAYDQLFQHIVKHSHSYYIDRFAGSILSKVNNVVNALDRLSGDVLFTYLTAIVQLIVITSFLLVIDVRAAFVFIMLVVVMGLFNRWYAQKQRERAKIAAFAATSLRARLVDVFGNMQAVRQYVQGHSEASQLDTYSQNLKTADYKRFINMEWMLFWNGLILVSFSLVVFGLLIRGWEAGLVTIGDLILILALYIRIGDTLIFIGRAFSGTARAVGEMSEGLEDLLVPIQVVDIDDAKVLTTNGGRIEWNTVDFAFEGQKVFQKFSLEIPAGQRIGLVGQSGAGKTTFVSLLLRQHDIDGGQIVIDGQNISEITQDSLRQAIAVVPQEPALFHRSIKENILYGNLDATEEEVIEVAKKAQAHDFIMELPEGYNTMVGERGVKLSGGQKQRVAIARAMLKDAPILVLDEATSALDSESEVAIQKALHTLMKGRTVIAVAHRLSTLREMDRIIVMEQGQVKEDGNHETLSTAGGTYERLWNHQAGGFV